jgi:glutathione S-transferase
MTLILHAHPLSSYCWKALIALYENGSDFELRLVDFGDPDSRAAFRALWPMAKMPVLEDLARGVAVPEASILIEYLMIHHPGKALLIPTDSEAALEVRLRDRFYDLYVQSPMQKIVGDRLRPEGEKNPAGVADARRALAAAYDAIEARFAPSPWAAGGEFSLADCAAAPALFYANKVAPFAAGRPLLAAFLDRLQARPSVARVLAEAEPYFAMFPSEG